MSTTPNVRKRTKKTGGRGSAHASRSHRVSGQEVSTRETSHEIEDHLDCANPAYVGVQQALTRNLGNYESLKLGVNISLPCLPNEDSIRDTFNRAVELASEFMDEQFNLAAEELDLEVGDDD